MNFLHVHFQLTKTKVNGLKYDFYIKGPTMTRYRQTGLHTAGLPISYTVGRRHNFCCRDPILIPRPDSETSAQTTRDNVHT